MPSEAVRRVFEVVDTADGDAFAALFADDGRMTFGNGEPMEGRAAVAAGIGAFFAGIAGLRHRVLRDWVDGADTIVELEVTYDRLDGRSVTLPAVARWHSRPDGRIDDYRVFADLAPLYAPPEAA